MGPHLAATMEHQELLLKNAFVIAYKSVLRSWYSSLRFSSRYRNQVGLNLELVLTVLIPSSLYLVCGCGHAPAEAVREHVIQEVAVQFHSRAPPTRLRIAVLVAGRKKIIRIQPWKSWWRNLLQS